MTIVEVDSVFEEKLVGMILNLANNFQAKLK